MEASDSVVRAPSVPHFGRALLGSTVGVSVGTGLGLLLLKAASQVESDPDRYDQGDDPAEEAAGAAFVAGGACIVAGGPIGAVEIGGIDQHRRDAYVGAAVGEFVGGVLGYVLATQLQGGTSIQLIGLGTGVAVGAASGTVLVAKQKQKVHRGLIRYQKEHWRVMPPSVQVRVPLEADREPSVGIALVSIRL